MKSCPCKLMAPVFYSLLSLALVSTFFGCKGTEAEAQTKKRIETFSINQGTFLVISDDVPSIDVKGNATVYTMTADNTAVEFIKDDNTPATFRLDTGDILIEWPESGRLTMIRDNP